MIVDSFFGCGESTAAWWVGGGGESGSGWSGCSICSDVVAVVCEVGVLGVEGEDVELAESLSVIRKSEADAGGGEGGGCAILQVSCNRSLSSTACR